MKHAWAAQAIALGAWETTALLTHRRVPTITATIRRCHHHNPPATRVAVCLWLAGLGRHLLAQERAQ